MKRISVTLSFFLASLSTYSQIYDSIKDSWDKIIITDSHIGWRIFKNQFEIKRSNNEVVLVNKSDTVLNKINKSVLDKFFNSLTNEKQIAQDPLKIFGKDSIWLNNQATKLWFDYLDDVDESAEIDSFAIRTIKDYTNIKSIVSSIQGRHWTDDYPFTSILIIRKRDTLRVQSNGQYPYMMPWRVNNKIIYNSGIPTSISEMFPKGMPSNKVRLGGDSFDYYLINRVYESLIEDHRNYIKAKLKYPRQFTRLEQDFTIDKAELSDMGSIEWGGFISAPCLELILKSNEIPDNISFSVVFGRRIKLHSIKPIIRKQSKLVNQLSSNPVYQYTLRNSKATGEIHFVNRRSLSGEAKRNFKSDLTDNGMKKSKFRGRYRKAIFYELTETSDKGSSFSRWILLKNGTNILWEINGKFLMNLIPDVVKEQGYVCRVITKEDWDN